MPSYDGASAEFAFRDPLVQKAKMNVDPLQDMILVFKDEFAARW